MEGDVSPLFGKDKKTEPSEAPKGLVIRKLADYSEGEHTRVKRWNTHTGEAYLADPQTGEYKPWPLAGVLLIEVPQSLIIPTSTVNAGRAEGWIELENAKVVHRSGGSEANPWAVTHTFEQGDALTFHTIEGDVRYKIVHQPDKYLDDGQPGEARVDWFYLGELDYDRRTPGAASTPLREEVQA